MTQNAENENQDETDVEPPKDQQIINRFGFLFIACETCAAPTKSFADVTCFSVRTPGVCVS